MGLYDVPLSMSLLDFGMETMLANFHMCGVKSSFQHAREDRYIKLLTAHRR